MSYELIVHIQLFIDDNLYASRLLDAIHIDSTINRLSYALAEDATASLSNQL